jgi:hypothetical protein
MRAVAAGLGAVFGFLLVWSGMSDPDVIRRALLFQESYLFLFMGSAVATATVGQLLLRRGRFEIERPQRRHVTGSIVFGIGWGITNACPAPIVTQVGMGIGWGALTLAGVGIGVYAYQRRTEQAASGSAASSAPPTATVRPAAGLPHQLRRAETS